MLTLLFNQATGANTGVLATTENPDVAAFAGNITITGFLAVTETGDKAAFSQGPSSKFWTPSSLPVSAWSAEVMPVRVFDPYVFARLPTFDTGTTQGVWNAPTRPAPNWIAE